MIKSKDFIIFLKSLRLTDFLMVPCSIFKPLSDYLLNNKTELIFPPNEAHAVGFAVGSYSVSNEPAVIFMQNSGINNIANAITSLHSLYKIPMVLIVSWRGEPGKNDAPEHQIMGEILKKYLSLLDIPFKVLSKNWEKESREMIQLSRNEKKPVALIVRDGFFDGEKSHSDDLSEKYSLSRFEAIKIIKDSLEEKTIFISTNGFTSRDSFSAKPTKDFYMLGSMGHSFSIGAGVACSLKNKKSNFNTVILDGDGGCLMHLGSLALVGIEKIRKSRLIYILLDNEAYESTGSQPTLSSKIDFLKLAEGFGFPQIFSTTKANDLKNILERIDHNKAAFIFLRINRKKGMGAIRVSDKYNCEQISKRFRNNFTKK